MRLSRRALLAGLSALAVAGPAAAEEAPIDKGFPYLEQYLKLPAAERDRFALAYYLARDGKPATGVKVSIVDRAAQTPVPLGPKGRLERLPTLAQLQSKTAKVVIDAPEGAKLALSLSIEPNVRPAAEMNAADLAASVAQAARGAKKAAGLIGFAVPKLQKVRIYGGAGGQAVFADGSARALPVEKGAAVFDPTVLKGAAKLRFTTAPERLVIA
ncbi:DUF2987 domain-containing protein [Caulobacter sp. 17J80-11]|uniref:DUF2987 domain-containing protein n=1 Tax=Caulobacter sp. 17J80-11 TaxID=2763502 RepID=UPI001653BC30|nr:DUF2987 domain-containing protein [Caulobacter sp. 17J80-11]MBC6980245.1 hypothetical protein [Caulobacter sp. 17J80-11]